MANVARQAGAWTPARTPLLVMVALALWGLFVSRTLPSTEYLMVDFTQYYDAGRAMLNNSTPYHPDARQQSSAAFLLPPVFAVVIMPLALLPVATANQAWFLLSLAFLAGGCIAVVALVGGPWPDGRRRTLPFLGLMIVAFGFLPVWTSARLGQITPLLFCLVTGALVARAAGRQALGGALLGTAIAFKFIPLPLVAFALWVGWRRFALAAIATAVGLHLVSAALYPAVFFDYWLNAVRTIPSITSTVNLSLIGLSQRAGEFSAVLLPLALLGSGLMALAPFAVARKMRDRPLAINALALAVAAMVVAAPLVEHHYLVFLLLPVWLLLCQFARQRDLLRLGLLGGMLLLMSIPYRIARLAVAAVPLRLDSESLGEMTLMTGAVALYLLLLATATRPSPVGSATS